MKRESYKSLVWRGIKYVARLLRTAGQIEIQSIIIKIDRAGWSPRMVRQILKENYERSESVILKATLSKSDRVLEIGGGVGFIAVLAARIVGEDHVTVYEANDAIIASARQTLALNAINVDIPNAAIVPDSYQDVSVKFHVHKDFWASSLASTDCDARVVEVNAVPLGEAIAELSPTFLIIDVEGAEVDILTGADLPGVSKICLEIHPGAVGEQKISAMIGSLMGHGFVIDFTLCDGDVLFLYRPDA